MNARPEESEFIATVVCPGCGVEHVAPPSKLPQFCDCGQRFWSPVEPRKKDRS